MKTIQWIGELYVYTVSAHINYFDWNFLFETNFR
jgi:hypothetical protein